jgi:hypothetical protein
MSVTLRDLTMGGETAPGGLARILIAKVSDITSMEGIDSTTKKIPDDGIVMATGKRFYEFDYLKNSEKAKAGVEAADIGTPQSPAFEAIGKCTIKGKTAVDDEYLKDIRGTGRLVIAYVGQDDIIRIAGTKTAPAIMHKLNDKGGMDIEEFSGWEVEFYYKSAKGLLHYDGTVTDLLTAGA